MQDEANQVSQAVDQARLTVIVSEIADELRLTEKFWRYTVNHAIRVGQLLIEAKGLLEHGQWLPWLDANFAGSERTAQGYMKLARNAESIADAPTISAAIEQLTGQREDGGTTIITESVAQMPLALQEAISVEAVGTLQTLLTWMKREARKEREGVSDLSWQDMVLYLETQDIRFADWQKELEVSQAKGAIVTTAGRLMWEALPTDQRVSLMNRLRGHFPHLTETELVDYLAG